MFQNVSKCFKVNPKSAERRATFTENKEGDERQHMQSNALSNPMINDVSIRAAYPPKTPKIDTNTAAEVWTELALASSRQLRNMRRGQNRVDFRDGAEKWRAKRTKLRGMSWRHRKDVCCVQNFVKVPENGVRCVENCVEFRDGPVPKKLCQVRAEMCDGTENSSVG